MYKLNSIMPLFTDPNLRTPMPQTPLSPSRKKLLASIFIILVLLYLAAPGVLADLRLITPFFLPQIRFEVPPGPLPALLISEVFYDSAVQPEPGSEWIEIYNPGSSSLLLSDFRLGDAEFSGDEEGMYRFPSGQSIAPGQVLVIANRAAVFYAVYGWYPHYELNDSSAQVLNMIKDLNYSSGNCELTNTSDEVFLLTKDYAVVDALSYGASIVALDPPVPLVAPGSSLERRPANQDRDKAGDFIEQVFPNPGQVSLIIPTPTALPTRTPTPPAFNGSLLLSEVVYDPAGSDPAGEWLEVYNPQTEPIDLSNFKIGDEETPLGGEGMYRFPTGALILPAQTLVIANEAAQFYTIYGLLPDLELKDTHPAVPQMLRYTAWASGEMNLSDSGDEVLLLDGQDYLVDALSWGSSVFAFSPSASPVSQGHSLERYPPDQDTDTAADWREQPQPLPGQVLFPTSTPTASETPTSISSATASPTGSSTPTASATPTASETATPSATATETATPTVTPTPTATEPGVESNLLVSEVMYQLINNDPATQWIEIYNTSSYTLTLSGVKIGDEETQGGGEGMAAFPDGAQIAPQQVLVIAKSAAGFEFVFGWLPDYEFTSSNESVPDLIPYTTWASGVFNLAGQGDEVLILDSEDQFVDAMSYGISFFAFDPPAPPVPYGHSLERYPADVDTNTAQDWIDQAAPAPGSVRLAPELR